MKFLGNVLWFIFGGFVSAVGWFFSGLLWCITIVGIPFGVQCFKMAGLVIAPFGKNVRSNFASHPIANVLWMIFFGWEFALGCVLSGVLFCITIIGIPFGKQWFKLAALSLIPFGANVN